MERETKSQVPPEPPTKLYEREELVGLLDASSRAELAHTVTRKTRLSGEREPSALRGLLFLGALVGIARALIWLL